MKRLIILSIVCLLILSVNPVLSEDRISGIDIRIDDIRSEIEYLRDLLAQEEEMIDYIIKEVRGVRENMQDNRDYETVNIYSDLEGRAD